ncbi:MAG TPA: hypothetical protein VJQ54_24165 [Candidatus Sulfotelmatobacter sp.]|nr:hypothetical protein [Candidatus Sulfotelmatobacter sp.]
MLAFDNLPRSAFPIHIRAYKLDGSNEMVWESEIEAGSAFTIPPLEKIHRTLIKVLIRWGDGTEKKLVMWNSRT